MTTAMWRAQAFERLSSQRFDLLVIGAGITGARIAADAAAMGMRVALVDRGDIGGETSSASSKLIHGGFRYLSLGQLDLVCAASRERRALQHTSAGLIGPLSLVLAVRRGGPYGAASVAAGVLAYRLIAGIRDKPSAEMHGAAAACRLIPQLQRDGLRSCALLHESQTDDARFTLATAQAAARHGAVVCTYAEVMGLEARRGSLEVAEIHDRLSGADVRCRFRSVVNAAGPWVDVVRRLDDPRVRASVRFSKGIHVTLPLPLGWRAGLIVPVSKGYAVHAVPWHGTLLVGTTDSEHDGPPSVVEVSDHEVARMVRPIAEALTDWSADQADVLCAFAGLRVLPVGTRHVRVARRDHVVTESPRGLVSVAGGKLTTHRLIARETLAVTGHRIGLAVRSGRSAVPPAARRPRPHPALPHLEPDVISHLRRVYGPAFNAVIERTLSPDAFERIHPDGPDLWTQVDHAVEHEWAMTADDLLRRRTTLAVRGLATVEVRRKVTQRAESQPQDQYA